jgi:hypothetical protein
VTLFGGNHCAPHGLNNCFICKDRDTMYEVVVQNLKKEMNKMSKTEKVTKEVYYSPKHDIAYRSDVRELPEDAIPAQLTYEVPREAMKVEFEAIVEKPLGKLIHAAVFSHELGKLEGKIVRCTIEEVVE